MADQTFANLLALAQHLPTELNINMAGRRQPLMVRVTKVRVFVEGSPLDKLALPARPSLLR